MVVYSLSSYQLIFNVLGYLSNICNRMRDYLIWVSYVTINHMISQSLFFFYIEFYFAIGEFNAEFWVCHLKERGLYI